MHGVLLLALGLLLSPVSSQGRAKIAPHLSPPEDVATCVAFLRQYMPEQDKSVITDDFLRRSAVLALEARHRTAWGRAVPWDVFLNEVLPYALLDEPRNDWRTLFYPLLMPMVQNASGITDAFNTLNRHVWAIWGLTFKSDQAPEILSPDQMICAGFGSCSACSIFLAAACRSVGLPCRVAGTASWVDPRAPSSERFNNHNWVEVWDAVWSFSGSMEPDPSGRLNVSWFFPQPVRRALPGSRLHGVFASSYRPTADGFFPLAWDFNFTGVNAAERTQYYKEVQPQHVAEHAEATV